MNTEQSPDYEASRITVLESYGILDMPSDAVLDSLTQATASLCETPIALISLVDSNRLWFKSSCGLPIDEANRNQSFCETAIRRPGRLLEVEDALLDDRFNQNSLVTGDLKARFYAGMPLVTSNGYPLGTLCVMDYKPRRLSASQRDGLDQLASAVMRLLTERLDPVMEVIEHIVEQATPDAVLITDATSPDNPITYVNETFELMTGYTKEDAVGRNCRFLHGPDSDGESVQKLDAVMREQRACTLTIKSYRKDGHAFWNDMTVSPVRDSAGRTVSIVSVMRDASDRFLALDNSRRLHETRKEREQARASRNRLARIVEESSNEIFVSDARSFRLLDANRAGRENLGYTLEECRELYPWDFVGAIGRENLEALIAPLRNGEVESRFIETFHRRKDGSSYPVTAHVQYMGTQIPPVYVAIAQDVSERQQQRESVRLRERAIEALDVGVCVVDVAEQHHPIVYVNQMMCEMTGYLAEELIGEGAAILQKDTDQQSKHLAVQTAMSKGESLQVLFNSTRKDGSHFTNELSLSPFHDSHGSLTHYIGINRDVTLKQASEERLQRSRKIEAIGQLAGGVAHDFNNLLSVITGNLELLDMKLQDEQLRDYFDKADSAARMGARLTRRLLSFARQGQLEPKVLDANEHIIAAVELLHTTIGEHISLVTDLSDDLWSIEADASEIENTVVNLLINARDAMQTGGEIVIETRNVTLGPDDAEVAFGLSEGHYIVLSVSDTGEGMNDEVLARVFEPFFTTKDTSTGLGLASILGFAQQSGGDVHVSSEPNEGAVIKVFLPAHFAQPVSSEDVAASVEKVHDSIHRILVVEDNEMVRELAVTRMRMLGYDVLQANNGPNAIDMLANDPDFDLVLTDIVMAGGLSGLDVARWVQRNLPTCRVLLTSGYSEQLSEINDVDIASLEVLKKPYDLAELQRCVNDVLSNESAVS